MMHDTSERAIVGCLMADEHVGDELADRLSGSQFDDPTLGAIFDHLIGMRSQGRSYRDPSVCVAELKRAKIGKLSLFDASGGHSGLTSLADERCSEASVGYHAQAVIANYRRRALIDILRKARNQFDADASADADQILSWIESEVSTVAAAGGKQSFTMLGELMSDLADNMVESRSKQQQLGVPTGFPVFDELTGGYFPGEITVIGAWTSIGKTSFAMQTAMHAATARRPRAALIISLEMKQLQMAHRVAASELGIDVGQLRSGTHSERDEQSVRGYAANVAEIPLGIHLARNATVPKIRSVAQAFRAKHGLDLLVVDYLQLITATPTRKDRRLEVEQISADLKTLAMEFSIPIVSLSQLNRDDEGKGKPSVKSLRESAAIGQDADAVWFIHRENRQATDALLLVDKNRQGPAFPHKMTYEGARFKFHEIVEFAEFAEFAP